MKNESHANHAVIITLLREKRLNTAGKYSSSCCLGFVSLILYFYEDAYTKWKRGSTRENNVKTLCWDAIFRRHIEIFCWAIEMPFLDAMLRRHFETPFKDILLRRHVEIWCSCETPCWDELAVGEKCWSEPMIYDDMT